MSLSLKGFGKATVQSRFRCRHPKAQQDHWSERRDSVRGRVGDAAARCYSVNMSAVEQAVEQVRRLDEAHARQLLAWLEAQQQTAGNGKTPLGAVAMLGFARRFHEQPRTTTEWMTELRAGEQT